MEQEINARGWRVLEHSYELVNLDIISKFYASVKPNEDEPLVKVFWVHGQRVPFDRDVIHAYIEDSYMENSRRLNPFTIQVAKGNWD